MSAIRCLCELLDAKELKFRMIYKIVGALLLLTFVGFVTLGWYFTPKEPPIDSWVHKQLILDKCDKDITISRHSNTVILQGTVENNQAKQFVVASARKVSRYRKVNFVVRDELQVAPLSQQQP